MPRPSRPNVRHDPIAELLRSQPGVWYLVCARSSLTSAKTMVSGIGNGYLRAYNPAGSFEAKVKVTQDEPEVWARYVAV